MAENHRVARGAHDVERTAPLGVGAVHQNPGVVDSGHHAFAQRCQALREIVASARHWVVAVVGKVDLAHAEIAVQSHHFGGTQQRQRALKVKAHRQPTRVTGRLNVAHGFWYQVTLGLGVQASTKGGDNRQDLAHWVHVHADIDAHEMHAECPVALQRFEAGLWVQGEASVGFPAQAGIGGGVGFDIVHGECVRVCPVVAKGVLDFSLCI